MFTSINLFEINYWAVLVSGLANIISCLILYLPKLFGNAWMGLTGKDLSPAHQWIPVGLSGHFLNVLVLAVLVNSFNAKTMVQGIGMGVLVCVGFIVPLEAGELVWDKIPFRLFLMRVFIMLVTQILSGIILAVWR